MYCQVISVELKRGGSFAPSKLFRMKELEKDAKHFDKSNLIGFGSFDLVFKGLLCDGIVVAIKKVRDSYTGIYGRYI